MKKVAVFIFLLSLYDAHAQLGQPGLQRIFTGPKGICIPLYGSDLHPAHIGDRYVIYRQTGASESLKRIGEVQLPQTAEAFRNRFSVEQWQAIQLLNSPSDAPQLAERILRNDLILPDSMRISAEAWESLGWIYIDRSIDPVNSDITYEVKVIHGGVEQTLYREKTRKISHQQYPKFHSYRKTFLDSSVLLSWYAIDPRFVQARITLHDYSHKPLSGDGSVLISYHKKDTMFMTFSGQVVPGNMLVAAIQPVDIAGNIGPVSDSLRLLAAGLPKSRQLMNLRLEDTVEKITLAWDPLPVTAQFSGIRIMKSRSANGPFITLDTISDTQHRYTDFSVIPGTQYYYVVHPILPEISALSEPAMAILPAVVSAKKQKPEAPQQLRLREIMQKGIQVSWQPISDLQVDAYYVLRGSSRDSLTIISPPVRDTVFLDSVKHADPARTWHYAVMALSSDMQWSDSSKILSWQPKFGRFVEAPGGITALTEKEGVILRWDDVRQKNANIAGYLIYRRKKGESNFTMLNHAAMPTNKYVDTTSLHFSYEYACTSVDFWGNQSIFSPTVISSVGIDISNTLPPEFILTKRNGAIEIRLIKQLGKPDNSIRYKLYRRVVGSTTTPTLIATMTVLDEVHMDRQAPEGKLLAYTLTSDNKGMESKRTIEKTIRK